MAETFKQTKMNFPKLPSQKEAMKTNQYSQHGEEVVLQKIFDHIGTTNKFFVDYGAGDGYNLSNTRHFLNNGWTGLMMDGFHESKDVKKEMITPMNIVRLFETYNVPKEFDLLSQDLDSCDHFILTTLLNVYSPRVIICEFNPALSGDTYLAYEEGYVWDGTDKYGFSFEAGKNICHEYSLVYNNGCNLIFIHKDIVDIDLGITHEVKRVHPHNPKAQWITV